MEPFGWAALAGIGVWLAAGVARDLIRARRRRRQRVTDPTPASRRNQYGGLSGAEVAALRTQVAAVPDQSTDPEVWGELIEISDALEGYRREAKPKG